MKTILGLGILLTLGACNAFANWYVDFESSTEASNWVKVNDSVMGGVSVSSLQFSQGLAYFKGELSLANNGGFASVRRVGNVSLDSANGPLIISVKGDGREYQVRLRTNRGYDGAAYVASFTTSDQWQEFEFSERDFNARFRGRPVPNAPALSFGDVQQIGFMLADKRSGAFTLVIRHIAQR